MVTGPKRGIEYGQSTKSTAPGTGRLRHEAGVRSLGPGVAGIDARNDGRERAAARIGAVAEQPRLRHDGEDVAAVLAAGDGGGMAALHAAELRDGGAGLSPDQ